MVMRLVLSLGVLILIVAGVLPVGVMLWQSVVWDGHFTIDAYRGLLDSRGQWQLLGRSLTLATSCAFVSTAWGLTLGLVLGKTDLPLRRTFTVLFTLPLVLPPYVTAVSWFHILGREGWVARLLGPNAAITTSNWLFGLPGCIGVLSSIFTPVVMLLTIAFARGVNPRQEEAGRLVASWPQVLLHVTIPMIVPAVGLGTLLVFVLALGEFSVPSFLRYSVFPVETFTRFAAFYDFRAATAAALPLIVLTLLALVLERIYLRRKTYILQTGHGTAPLTIGLGRCRRPCLFGVCLLCFVWVLLPLMVLLSESLAPDAYRLALEHAGASLLRSLRYAMVGASILTIIGLLLGTLIHDRSFRFWMGVDSMTLFLFAIPGTVLGIGLILLWNRPVTQILYQSSALLVLGWIAQYSAVTSRITLSALQHIPPSLGEAARLAGAGGLRCMICILVPLIRPGLFVAWLAGFLFCLRDTDLSLLVYPPGRDPLPVRTFTLMANGSPPMIAALCVLMIVGTLIPLGLLALTWKGWERKT
ncbi:ABC transporter permease [Planctomycetota bacterium]